MANWPLGLPQCPLRRGFSGERFNNVVRSEMDTGFSKARPRYTAVPKRYNVQFSLTVEELGIFWDFMENVISDGAISFDWVDPITQAPATCRIIDVPKEGEPAGLSYPLGFTLEVLP